MSFITSPAAGDIESQGVARADPSLFKVFWPEVRGGYFFRHRRVFLDFLRLEGGEIFYLRDWPGPRPPFVLTGNWRNHEDITALWHIKAEGSDKKRLVLAAAGECFDEGTGKMITKLLDEKEAAEFGRWGFEANCTIALLERQLYAEPSPLAGKDGLKIVPFRKMALAEVLGVDTTAFDDFWRLDARTMEAVASSCFHNVFLLARGGEETMGYAIGGVNGRLGYLQRLGVHARHQGKGVGEDLALAMLHALYRRGASTVLVNTQSDNLTALNLYRAVGFRETPGCRYIMQYAAHGEDRGGQWPAVP